MLNKIFSTDNTIYNFFCFFKESCSSFPNYRYEQLTFSSEIYILINRDGVSTASYFSKRIIDT